MGDQSSQSSLSDVDDQIVLEDDENDIIEEDNDDHKLFAPREFNMISINKIRDKLLGVENTCKFWSHIGWIWMNVYSFV